MARRDPRTEWIRVMGYRRMTPQQRLRIGEELTRQGRWVALNMARKNRSDSKNEWELDFWNRVYGRALAKQVAKLERLWNLEAEPMEGSTVVHRVVDILEGLRIPYVIVGGYSSIFWGRPRTTQDADLMIQMEPTNINALVRALNSEFVVSEDAVRDAVRNRSEFNAIHRTEVYKVDFWIPATQLDQEALRRARRENLTPDLLAYIQSPEDTIISKLRWCKLANFSERQFEDALGVYEIQEPTLDQGYLDRWAQALELTDLLQRVREEAARPPES